MSAPAPSAPSPARKEFLEGFRDITPLSLGVAAYGLAFGLLAARTGLDWRETGAMGGLVFAGSSQAVALERLAAGTGPALAVVAGLALNLRILLMTASMRAEFVGRPSWQIALGVHLTSDENWALMHATRAKGRPAGYWYLVGGGASLMAVWVVATAAGARIAGGLPDFAAAGIGFAFTAAFILLLCGLWRGRQDLAPWAVAALTAGGSALLAPFDPSWGVLTGGVVGMVAAGMGSHD